MSANPNTEKIEARLRAVPGGEPPAELLDRLRDGIPDPLAGDPAVPADASRSWRAPRRLLAAALVVAVGGGLLAYRVVRRVGPLAGAVSETVAAERATPAVPERTATDAAARELESFGYLTDAESPAEGQEEGRAESSSPRRDLAAPPEVADSEADGVADGRRREDVAAPAAVGELRDAPPVPVEGDAPALAASAALAAPEDPVSKADVPNPSASELSKAAKVAARDGATPREELADRLEAARRAAGAEVPEPEIGAALVSPRLLRADAPPDLRYQEAPGVAPQPAPPPSTGGTTEPNDQAYGDMFFRSHGVNPFIDTEDDALSTFALDVDTGSYTLVRSYLDRGHLPPAEAVRVEEFVNFFDYGDAAPSAGDFSVAVEGAPSPFAAGPRYYLLRFGLTARSVERAERPPVDLVFVVDVSGSMRRDDRLELVRRSLLVLIDELSPADRVGLVSYGDRARIELEPTTDLAAVRRAVGRLTPGGSTNAEEGLVLGYEMAARQRRQGALTRVVLCSDGVANVGRTSAGSILDRIALEAAAGIELTTVGFGMGNYNDVLMEALADHGDGRYAYVDSLAEARRLFVEELTGTLVSVARDAKVQVAFDSSVVSRYRLLGYENRDVADERFRDDTVDAGEIGAGHRVTALYEVKLQERPRRGRPLATLSLRYHSPAAGEVVELSRLVERSDLAPSWQGARPGLRLASVVAEFAEVLRGSYWARQADPEDLLRRSRQVAAELPGDAAATELAGLVEKAVRLGAGRAEPGRDE